MSAESWYNSVTGTSPDAITLVGKPLSFNATFSGGPCASLTWKRDGLAVDTRSNASSSSVTLSWQSADSGLLRRVEASCSGAQPASVVWRVEVQEGADPALSMREVLSGSEMLGGPTLEITAGTASLAQVFLAAATTQKWLQYHSYRTWTLLHSVRVTGPTAKLRIKRQDAKTVKLCSSGDFRIVAQNNGAVDVQGVRIVAWDCSSNARWPAGSYGPLVSVSGAGDLQLRDSFLSRVGVDFKSDTTRGDLVSGNLFYGAFEWNVRVGGTSLGQMVRGNVMYTEAGSRNIAYGGVDTRDVVFRENKLFSTPQNCQVMLGDWQTFEWNEVVASRGNLVESAWHTLTAWNNVHDNGAQHNGFNGCRHSSYSTDDYCAHSHNYACFYFQVETPSNDPSTFEWPNHTYVFYSYLGSKTFKSAGALDMHGLMDSYFYDVTIQNSYVNILMGVDGVFFRKLHMIDDSNFHITEYLPNVYGFVHNVYIIDTAFEKTGDWDVQPLSSVPNHPVVHCVNTWRRNGDGPLSTPVLNGIGGYSFIARFYAWLDVAVWDSTGSPVAGATISVRCLNSTGLNLTSVAVYLPPPPRVSKPTGRLEPLPRFEPLSGATITTDSTGHSPSPNYGWSAESKATVALLYFIRLWSGSSQAGFVYEVSATQGSQTTRALVRPDESWLREDPNISPKTVVLTLNKPASKFSLHVGGGSGSGLYSAGQGVALVATAPADGMKFVRWIGDTAALTGSPNSSSATLTMPSADASLAALFLPVTYHLTLEGSYGSGDYPAGTKVGLDAENNDTSKEFHRWAGDVEHVQHPLVHATVLVMPKKDITVRAVFKPLNTFELTVVGGTGSGFYAPASSIALSVAESSRSSFVRWVGNDVWVDNEYELNTTLLMPWQGVTVRASDGTLTSSASSKSRTDLSEDRSWGTSAARMDIPLISFSLVCAAVAAI